MVKESPVYLFIGEDSLSKDIKLKKIKQEYLVGGIESFNLDILYARELNLKDFQERLLCLPVKAKKRIVVIKDVQHLREDIKEFILKYVRNPLSNILLVLDIIPKKHKDEFIERISRYVQICRFKEPVHLNTFALSRQIDSQRTDYALRILNQLLKNGERPERILGGLRYVWEGISGRPLEIRKKLKFLLDCDIDIKRGKLKPEFALEKLVVRLCALEKSLH